MPVLDRKLPHGRTARFWTYAAEWPLRLTVFDYTDTRSRDGPEKFLEDYRVFLQADAFAGYDGIYAGGQVKQVLCWAHARRKFYDAKSVQPEAAHAALAFIARLYAVERAARKLAAREGWDLDEATSRERWHAARFELRRQRLLPILAEFYDWLEGSRRGSSVLPKSPVRVAIRYVLPRWEAFTRYCTTGNWRLTTTWPKGRCVPARSVARTGRS